MPALLRVHLASLGHRDARFAPLTLELTGPDGHPCDSALWLRNRGGKSSLLNLLFSVFRPGRREFLGTSSEGRSRKLEDYVGGGDLGFVITEWLPRTRSGAAPTGPPGTAGTLLVGQLLAWRRQQRTSDLSQLRRIFFTLRTDDRFGLRDLPVPGLGAAAASTPEEFVDALKAAQRARPARELVLVEESHTRWLEQLRAVGLDPELFGYQLRMNQREGAADELFRFSSAAQFLEFLLELTFDRGQADEVSATLTEFRTQLLELPRRRLERDFAVAVTQRLTPLVAALQAEGASAARLEQAEVEACALAGGLERSAQGQRERGAQLAQQATAAAEARQGADNELRTLDRWTAGLEREGLRLDLELQRQAHAEAQRRSEELELRRRLLRAVAPLRRIRELTARQALLTEQLRSEEQRLVPLQEQAELAGSRLEALLSEVVVELLAARDRLTGELAQLDESRQAVRQEQSTAQEATGALRQQLRQVEGSLAQRDRERERLIAEGDVEPRETAQEAVERWRAREEGLGAERERLQAQATELERVQGELQARVQELSGELGRLQAELDHRRTRLDEALAARGRLEADARLREVEETERVDPAAPGLLPRVLLAAEGARRELLRLHVDGAEDERSLRALEGEGLLPPSADVERVVERLRAAGLRAWPAYSYLADNLPERPAAKRQLLELAPALFSGVMLPDVETLQRATQLSGELSAELRGPVQLTPCTLTAPTGEETQQTGRLQVVGPDGEGAFDRGAALRQRGRLNERVGRRRRSVELLLERERQLRQVATEVDEFLERWGEGRLEALASRVDGDQQEADRRAAELTTLRRQLDEHGARRKELLRAAEQAERQRRDAERRLERLLRFVQQLEDQVEGWRDERDRLRSELTRHAERLGQLGLQGTQLDARRGRAQEEQAHAQERMQSFENERQRIVHRTAAEVLVEPGFTLEQARVAYETLVARLRRERSASQLQGQLDELQSGLQEASGRYLKARRGQTDEQVRTLDEQTGARLDEVERGTEQEARQATLECGQRSERIAALSVQLDQRDRRRESRDLPPEGPRPSCGEEARQQAAAYRQQREGVAIRAAELRDEEERCQGLAGQAQRRGELREGLRQRIVDQVTPHPSVPPRDLGEEESADGPELGRRVDEVLAASRLQRRQLEADQQEVRAQLQAVRQVGVDPRFAEHRSAVKERLADPDEALRAEAPRYLAQLRERIAALEDEIGTLEHHRRALVEEVLQVAESAELLLEDAAAASRLPETLGRWAGKPFLRITLDFPKTADERRARLAPLVQRIADGAAMPDGLRLAYLAVQELNGGRPTGVTILKPDALQRTDRIDVAAMANFSGAERLTCAVLLYCSLVRLRARRRGLVVGATDGGVLVLDNPIGTCSSVPLLELQRTVAAAMGVQLVYTTGVDDLAALAQLPNIVRLRNSHRNLRTGELHVTVEGEATESIVDGARVAGR